MKMPDVMYIDIGETSWEASVIGDVGQKYHHSRIVEALRKENEELKAKLDKAIKAVEVPSDMVDADLMFCLQKFDNIPYKTVQEIARATADIIAQRARTTLEEI